MRQLLSERGSRACSPFHLLQNGSETEREEGTPINTLSASSLPRCSCHAQASAWIRVLCLRVGAFPHYRSQRRRPSRRTRTGASCPRLGFAAWLQLKSRNTVSHWRPWLFIRRSRPSQAALGAGGQSRREGLAVASGAGGTGAGWGEAQVAAALALVLALFSRYTRLTPNLVGDSGSGVVVHGRCSCGWAQTAPKSTAEAHQRKWSRRA